MNKCNKRIIRNIILIILINNDSWALDKVSARSQALEFGAKNNSAFEVSDSHKNEVPGYQTDKPEESSYFSAQNMNQDAQNKIQDSEVGKLINQEIPQRARIDVLQNDGFLNNANPIQDNTDEVVNMMTGNYENCQQVVKEVPKDFEIKSCQQYQDRVSNSCFLGNIVKIDNKSKYKCGIVRPVESRNCSRVLNLTCNSFSICSKNSSNISVSGNGASYQYSNLLVTIPWRSGGCSSDKRVTKIFIKDKNLIGDFKLQNISWDDSIEIKINGKSVYKNWKGCERWRVFRVGPNIDLKKYLVNGENKIEMILRISGRGFASAKYLLTQKCCKSFDEKWEEKCPN